MQSIKNLGSSLASGIGFVYNEVYNLGTEAGAEFVNMYRDVAGISFILIFLTFSL